MHPTFLRQVWKNSRINRFRTDLDASSALKCNHDHGLHPCYKFGQGWRCSRSSTSYRPPVTAMKCTHPSDSNDHYSVEIGEKFVLTDACEKWHCTAAEKFDCGPEQPATPFDLLIEVNRGAGFLFFWTCDMMKLKNVAGRIGECYSRCMAAALVFVMSGFGWARLHGDRWPPLTTIPHGPGRGIVSDAGLLVGHNEKEGDQGRAKLLLSRRDTIAVNDLAARLEPRPPEQKRHSLVPRNCDGQPGRTPGTAAESDNLDSFGGCRATDGDKRRQISEPSGDLKAMVYSRVVVAFHCYSIGCADWSDGLSRMDGVNG